MDAWAIILITMSSFLLIFILIFWFKNRNASKRQEEIDNATQIVVGAQPQFQPPPSQQYPPPTQNYPSAYPTQQPTPYPPPYASSQPPYPNQQVGFVNQATVFVPQQSPFVPSTGNQGIINSRDQSHVYYNPNMPQNIAMHSGNRTIMATTNAVHTAPSAPF
jgi:type II secretory pathway pseudopilin PulG